MRVKQFRAGCSCLVVTTALGALMVPLSVVSSNRAMAQEAEASPESSAEATEQTEQQVDDPSASSSGTSTTEVANPTPLLLAPANTLKGSSEKASTATEDDEPEAPSDSATSAEINDDDNVVEAESTSVEETDATQDAEAEEANTDRQVPPAPSRAADRSNSRLRNRTPASDIEPDTAGDDSDAVAPTRSIVRPSRNPRSLDSDRNSDATQRRAYRLQPEARRRSVDDRDAIEADAEILPAPAVATSGRDTGTDNRDRAATDDRPTFGIYLRRDTSEAAIVDEVVPRSFADRIGVKANDVIVAVDGEPVRSADEFHELALRVPADDDPTISISRTFDLRLRANNSANGRATRATVYNSGAVSDRDRDVVDDRRPVRVIVVPAPGYDPRREPVERPEVRRAPNLRERLFGR